MVLGQPCRWGNLGASLALGPVSLSITVGHPAGQCHFSILVKVLCKILLTYISRDLENSLGMIYKVIEQEGLSIIVDQAELIYMVLG